MLEVPSREPSANTGFVGQGAVPEEEIKGQSLGHSHSLDAAAKEAVSRLKAAKRWEEM